MMPTLAEVEWQLTGLDLRVSRRELRAADRAVAAQVQSIDVLLDDWAHRPRKRWDLIDQLLDERLFVRGPDAMATGPVVPGPATNPIPRKSR